MSFGAGPKLTSRSRRNIKESKMKIQKLQEIEEMMNEARDKGNWKSKYEGMFVTALKNVAKSKSASKEYEAIYGISPEATLKSYC
jgi:hypothetical protein